MINPYKDGLPALRENLDRPVAETILIAAIEALTAKVRKGYPIGPKAFSSAMTLINRMKALEDALEDRMRVTGAAGSLLESDDGSLGDADTGQDGRRAARAGNADG